MVGLHHDADTSGRDRFLERAGDLFGEAFLNLEPPREDVDDARARRIQSERLVQLGG